MMLGVTIHIILDMLGRAGVQLLWPLPARISFYGVTPLIPMVIPVTRAVINAFILDAAIGVAWIAYLMWKKRLSP